MKTITFNTNRGYSKDGQKISVSFVANTKCPILGNDTVLMELIDHTRHITQFIELDYDQVCEANIMHAYDARNYVDYGHTHYHLVEKYRSQKNKTNRSILNTWFTLLD